MPTEQPYDKPGSASTQHSPPFQPDLTPFPESFDRSGTGSIKWATAGAEGNPARIPMGVADMDLPGCPAVFHSLAERLRHPVIGYTLPDPRSRELIAAWYRDRFGAAVDPEWIVQLPFGPRTAIRFLLDAAAGLAVTPLLPAVPAVPAVVPPSPLDPAGGARHPGAVMATTPEYSAFEQVARAAGLPYQEIPLQRMADGYRLPVEAFEKAAARHAPITAIVLSSPHNPTGRVWSEAEIRRMAMAAASSGGVLISDEVHSDLVHGDGPRHPVAVAAVGDQGLAEHTVTVHSIGKTFNVSGLADVFLLVPSADLRQRLVRVVEGHGFFQGARPLAAVAQDAALAAGGPWLERLTAYLTGNRDLAVRQLTMSVPGLVTCAPQASYLLWLDGAALLPVGTAPAGAAGASSSDQPGTPAPPGTRHASTPQVSGPQSRSPAEPPTPQRALLDHCDLHLQDGTAFGTAGRGFLRLNFALPRPRLAEAIRRIEHYAARRRQATGARSAKAEP